MSGLIGGCLSSEQRSVQVLAAGSLAVLFEEHVGSVFRSETDIQIRGEYYGTNAIMRMVEEGTKHPDVVVSADASLLRDRLYHEVTDWDVEFASNTVGIGYNPNTEFGQQIDGDIPWYDLVLQLEEGDVSMGDPDLDPLGYRAIQAFELAEREHDLDGFRDRMRSIAYEEPDESQIMAGIETNARVAAIVYRNMAVDHEMPFYEFPDTYNFADPTLTDHYATAEYTTNDGYTVKGRPVLYNVTVTDTANSPDAGRQLVQFLVDNPSLLETAGLKVNATLPKPNGKVPADITV